MAEAADPYRQVDMLTIMSLFQQVADHTNRPDIGLELGLSIDLQQLGPFGFLFLNAPTVGHALSDFVRYGPAFQTQAHFGLRHRKGQFCLEYSSNHPDMPGWKTSPSRCWAFTRTMDQNGIVNLSHSRADYPHEK